MARLGLIAGGGGLPAAIADACAREGRPVFVIRLKGSADPGLARFAGEDVGLAELGRCFKALRQAGCDRVCFAGKVARPDFSTLMPDLVGLRRLPAVAAAARGGDDALLRAVLKVFETEGFVVEGVGEAAAGLALAAGPLGRLAPAAADEADLRAALDGALHIGASDQGQAAVARGGAVVATEDQAGTDALLVRVASLSGGPGGVLAKTPKPGQDLRVDLPTIGVATVERAAEAGLSGIVGPAGAVLVVDRAAVREAADRLGLFVFGVATPS